MPSYSYAPSSAPAKPPSGYPAAPPGQTIYASQPYTKSNPDGSQTTTQKSLRCYYPWSLLLICVGVSLLVSAIINLVTTAWIAAAVLGVIGAIVTFIGVKKWRADKAKTARGEHVSGPLDMINGDKSAPPAGTWQQQPAPQPQQIAQHPAQPQVVYVQQPPSRSQAYYEKQRQPGAQV